MLNLVHLKYFQDAFQFGSFAESARRNYVSRPAISQAIRSLEESLNDKLVYHKGNRAQLTAKGQWLLVKSQELLKQLHLIEQQIRMTTPDQARPVILCCSRSLAGHFLGGNHAKSPLACATFPIEIKLGDAFSVRRALEANEADFGIAVDDGNFQAFTPQILYKGDFQLVQVKSGVPHHLFIGDKGPEVTSFMRSPVSTAFTRITTIQSWELMASLASQGLGRAWIPDLLIASYPLLRPVKMDGIPSVDLQVVNVTRNRKLLSENSQALIELITRRVAS